MANGEFDLERVVTQEELVKRDTLPGAMRGGWCSFFVVLLLNEPILLMVLVLLLEIALCRVAPRFGVSRRPGANRCCRDFEVAPLSFGVCPCGPFIGLRV